MVHGPCGRQKPNAPCMRNPQGDITEVCHKSFPKAFLSETLWDNAQSYAQYRRRPPQDGMNEALYGDRQVTNAWVVPHNP